MLPGLSSRALPSHGWKVVSASDKPGYCFQATKVVKISKKQPCYRNFFTFHFSLFT